MAYCSAVPVAGFFIIVKMTVYEVFQEYRKNLKFLEEIICVVTICIKQISSTFRTQIQFLFILHAEFFC